MTLPISKQMTFWVVSAAVIAVFVAVFKAVLTPFVLGVVIAYLLNPLVKRFATKGIKRTTSSVLIIILFFSLTIIAIILTAPIIAKESAQLIDALPGYLEKFFVAIQPYTTWFQERFGENYMAEAEVFLKENISKILSMSGGIAGGIAAGGQALISLMTTIVITPLVAFYMMREWPVITQWFEDLIPRQHGAQINGIITQIDTKLSGFIRGQLTVAFLLGLIYAVALTIAGLNFGFLIGVSAGIMSIIPMVGSVLGLVVAVAIAWFQAGELQYVMIIAAIFMAGQIFEGNVLSPKLLGDSVGLHPLWILFALMAGGNLLGILGMLIAVPVAAVIGVLGSFTVAQYKQSSAYQAAVIAKEGAEKSDDATKNT